MYAFNLNIKALEQNLGHDRKEVISQLKNYLPKLPLKAVFYFETDGKSAFGPKLPFFTSVPQALTVVYYNESPLPNSFFDKPLFSGDVQGYQYSSGRGFGYYTSKGDLINGLKSKKFSIDDIYTFYYYAEKIKLKNTTSEIRKELGKLLNTQNEAR